MQNTERYRRKDFSKEITHFCRELKDNMVKAKSPNSYVQHIAREKIQKMHHGLHAEEKEMIQDELKLLEKRSRRMNQLASRSQDRRIDWMRHTLDVIESDVTKGGKKELKEA